MLQKNKLCLGKRNKVIENYILHERHICEAIIIVTFPYKQTILKYIIRKNLISPSLNVESKIWLTCSWVGKAMGFSCDYHSNYHNPMQNQISSNFMIHSRLSVILLMLCTFYCGHLFLISIFYQLTSEKNLWLFSDVLRITLAIATL